MIFFGQFFLLITIIFASTRSFAVGLSVDLVSLLSSATSLEVESAPNQNVLLSAAYEDIPQNYSDNKPTWHIKSYGFHGSYLFGTILRTRPFLGAGVRHISYSVQKQQDTTGYTKRYGAMLGPSVRAGLRATFTHLTTQFYLQYTFIKNPNRRLVYQEYHSPQRDLRGPDIYLSTGIWL